MGVMMQAFYWDCPGREARDRRWWSFVESKIPDLAQVGFSALWLPPASKGMNASGMGYDAYDYYDLGEHSQKGAVETWFGSRGDLESLIRTAHHCQLQVYADVVFNHSGGADSQEVNPLTGQSRWTKFTPASGKFPRGWNSFHPSEYESWDDDHYGDFPDLCHRNPDVFRELMQLGRWLVEDIGFDGFRYDFVKGYGYRGRGSWLITALQEFRYRRAAASHFKPFGVVEYWEEGDARPIAEYLAGANFWSDNPVAAFDFPLRNRLSRLCDQFGFDLRELRRDGTLHTALPHQAVTFVENHDIARDRPIVNDKLLAYAYILTHEGYPCVFWHDYFNYDLAQPGDRSGIAALVRVHESHAHGSVEVLHADDTLYVMQRTGLDGRGGLVFVLNNSGEGWRGARVRTAYRRAHFEPLAFRGRADTGVPHAKDTDHEGWCDFWAPQRGYAVYARS